MTGFRVRLETVVDIEADPDRVWEVLTDFEAYGQWSHHLTVLGRAAVGERLQVIAAAPGQPGMRFRPRVLAAVPGQVLRWRGRLLVPGLVDGVHEFVLTPYEGGTRLVHGESFSGLLIPFLGRLLADTEQQFSGQNLALKRRAEQVAARQ